MIEQLEKNIYSFQVPLPDNPLKWLNTYVVAGTDGGRNLLIDTGFKRPECFEALMNGFQELGIAPENTDVFLTHVHSDHTGNAPALQKLGCRLIMGRTDHQVLLRDTWDVRKQRVLREGMPQAMLDLVFRHNPAVIYAPGAFNAEEKEAGDTLSYGGYAFTLIETPGHTPGHMCLYDAQNRIMFSGDHVLFDITPNICAWVQMADSLGAYLQSLARISQYPVRLALPAHRTVGEKTFEARISELLAHHTARLNEARQIVHENPGINAYDLAGKMTWRIKARSWDDFPPGQKWFALGEALAHLDHLVIGKQITRIQNKDGSIIYE